MYNKRKQYELFIKTNVERLSDETLEKVVALMEPEVEGSIDKELATNEEK